MFVSFYKVLLNCCGISHAGVLYYEGNYYAVTTGTFGTNAFPLRRSADLVHWNQVAWVFPDWLANKNPVWASEDFWAPELHVVGGR